MNSSHSESRELLSEIKRLAIVAIVSDDKLLDSFVLKGGNALDLIYNISPRSSLDLDFSISGEIDDVLDTERRLKIRLAETFAKINYVAFDVKLEPRPSQVSDDIADFWGGYEIQFKIIHQKLYSQLQDNEESLRRNAEPVGSRGSTIFRIDVSKHEYCEGKERHIIMNHAVYVYSPEMIIAEKLRAICQQMSEYSSIVHRGRPGSPRARDFLDIHELVVECDIDASQSHFTQIVEHVFAAKKVPLRLLLGLEGYRDFHRHDFVSVLDTIKSDKKLLEFDEYFDFVLLLIETLKTFWNV